MREQLEQLVSSLLYEGYALYPYTPGATKNATPTPFGIVYPPAYAEALPTTFDHLRLECVLAAEPEAELRATVRFLQASGERHRAHERRLELAPAAIDELAGDGVGQEFAFEGARPLRGRARLPLRAPRASPGLWRVRGLRPQHHRGRAGPRALRRPGGQPALDARGRRGVRRVASSRRSSATASPAPRSQAARSVNTFPVLASPADDAILAATIVLPDHPRLAPESLGNLFDNTEIEEALLLHVQALSDDEREAIAEQDPAVQADDRARRAGDARPAAGPARTAGPG